MVVFDLETLEIRKYFVLMWSSRDDSIEEYRSSIRLTQEATVLIARPDCHKRPFRAQMAREKGDLPCRKDECSKQKANNSESIEVDWRDLTGG